MDERKRLNKNGMGRRERKEAEKVEKRLEKKVLREERRFDRLAVGGEKEREQMEGLYRRYADLQWDMASFTEGHEMWLAMKDPDTRTKAQRIQSQIFQQRAVFECFDQLRGGLSANNVIACVGMYVGLSLVNPEIRKTGQKMYAQALDGAVRYMENNPDKSMLGMRGLMMDNFAKKRDKYMRSANDGRMPFTAETAALASIRLDMECYRMMRDGEHVPDDVMAEHVKAVKTLEDVCAFDGVDMGDMARSKRIIVGKMVCEEEPVPGSRQGETRQTDRARKMEHVYAEFDVTGGWERAEPRVERTVVRDGNGAFSMADRKVWTGEYQTMGDDGFTPVDVDPFETPNVREPYSKEMVSRHVASLMCEYGKAYDYSQTVPIEEANVLLSLARSCGNTNIIGEAAIDAVIGDGKRPADLDGLADSPEEREMLEKLSDCFKGVFERADEDLGRSYDSRDELRGDMSAALHLGVLRGTVADAFDRSFARYGQDDIKTDDERILTARSVEMSSMACEYVQRCGGIDIRNEDFQEGAHAMAEHYAAICVADALGIDAKTDMSSPEARRRFEEALGSDGARKMSERVMREMLVMTNAYGAAYSGAICAGNTPEEAAQAMSEGFNDAALPHTHANDYAWEDGPEGENAVYSRELRSAITVDAANWGREAVSALSDREAFKKVYKGVSDALYRERAERREGLVRSKFGGSDYGDGPTYEPYDGDYE